MKQAMRSCRKRTSGNSCKFHRG